MLDAHNHQGKFAEDYVRVIASAAGLQTYSDDLDNGIQLGLRASNGAALISFPELELRIEGSDRLRRSGGEWIYDDLTESTFNLLAGHEFTVPRYLVVVNVPATGLADHEYHSEGVLLRQLAFYRSLADEAPIKEPNGQRQRPVRIPLGNVVTAAALRGLAGAGMSVA